METVTTAYKRGDPDNELGMLDEERKLRVLLGAPAGHKLAENTIDWAVKRFLWKAWKARRRVSAAINKEFDRLDIVWAKHELKWSKPKPKSASGLGPLAPRGTRVAPGSVDPPPRRSGGVLATVSAQESQSCGSIPLIQAGRPTAATHRPRTWRRLFN